MAGAAVNTGLAADTRSLDALRGAASRDPKAAVREAAKQFESLFMHELLKSMRAATPTTGLLDNEATKLGTEMLDQQLATKLTGLPGGLAEAITRQLERQMGIADSRSGASLGSVGKTAPWHAPAAAGTQSVVALPSGTAGSAQSFVAAHQSAAQDAERRTGIPAAYMIAQAAHETGWGRQDIRMANGQPSNNLFGMKAGADWKGPVAEITTTEYVQGVARKVTARFRAYATAAESFADYAKLMVGSPRYQSVLAQGKSPEGFAQSLQDAGYATDPQYANKLSRVIQTTLRLQRSAS